MIKVSTNLAIYLYFQKRLSYGYKLCIAIEVSLHWVCPTGIIANKIVKMQC